MYKRTSRTAHKQTFNPEPLRRCWEECLEKSSFSARKLAAEEFNKKNRWKKRGLAVVPMKFTVGMPTTFYNQVRSRRASLADRHDCLSQSCVRRDGPLQGEKEMGHFPIAGNTVDLGKCWRPLVSEQTWGNAVPGTLETINR